MAVYCEECREAHPNPCPPKDQWVKLKISLPYFGERIVELNPHARVDIWPGSILHFVCPWCHSVRPYYGTSKSSWPIGSENRQSCEVATSDSYGPEPIPMYGCISPRCFSYNEETARKAWEGLLVEAYKERDHLNRIAWRKEHDMEEAKARVEAGQTKWQEALAKAKHKITIQTKNGKVEIPAKQISKSGLWVIHQQYTTMNGYPELVGCWEITHITTGLSMASLYKDANLSLPIARKIMALLEEEGYRERFRHMKDQNDVSKLPKDVMKNLKDRVQEIIDRVRKK